MKDRIEIKIQDTDSSTQQQQPTTTSKKKLSFRSRLSLDRSISITGGDQTAGNLLHPLGYKPSLSPSAETDRFSVHSSKSSDGNQLDESQGFFLDLDTLDVERSTKSSRLFDERSPGQLLRSLVDYREELKVEIDSLNVRMSKIDKKIGELLALVVTTTQQQPQQPQQPPAPQKQQPTQQPAQQPRSGNGNGNNGFLDSSYSFGINSNLHLTQMTAPTNTSTTNDFPTLTKVLII